ncbi:MAG TPA: aldo/keto reductase [Longimicrobiaceae bacterium]|nr:aldo/keto reductase [Longimicrobiaceae bacterium]
MRYRTYPGTDITVSEVGFGLWTLAAGWWGEFSDDEAVAMLQRAFDLGITTFDSGDSYGNGRADELLARAFGERRDRVVITTKVGYDFYGHADARRGQQEIPHRADPEFIRFAVDKSLERLRTDVIDIVSYHNAHEEHVPDDAIWETLARLQEEGKIRAWGGALGPSNGYLYEGLELIQNRGAKNLQLINNILEPFPGEILTRAAEAAGTGLQVRVTHSSGMLEGKYTLDTEFAKNDHRRHRPRSWLVNGLKKLESLAWLHEGRGMTLGQAALKWLLASPAVMTTLPNIYNAEQLEEFAAASDLPDLTADDLRRIDELQRINFGVHEEHMRYKGTMLREGGDLAPHYRYAGDGYPNAPQVVETAAAD